MQSLLTEQQVVYRAYMCAAYSVKGQSPQQGRIIPAGGRKPNANVITLEKCKNILKSNGMTLEDNVLKELREYLYFLAGLQIEDEMAKEGLMVCAG